MALTANFPAMGRNHDMNEEEIANLLAQLPDLRDRVPRLTRKREDTILNVGGRGYFENPMSDLLAFFLDPSACHGLGDLVLSALLRCLGKEDLNRALIAPPIREAINRIDIVVPGEGFVIAIENKIRHGLNNPFEEYRNTINREYAQIPQENRIFCLLAPYRPTPAIAEWQWLDTKCFIATVWEELGRRLGDLEFSKWVLLLQEFLKTVEQEVQDVEEIMNDDQFQQIVNIYTELTKFNQIHRQFIDALKQKLRTLAIPIVGRENLWARESNWPNIIALPVLPYDKDNRKVSFLLYDGQIPDNPRYSIQVYSLNPLQPEDFSRDFSGEERVSGVRLYVYRKDYNELNEAFEGFEQALKLIMDHPAPPAAAG